MMYNDYVSMNRDVWNDAKVAGGHSKAARRMLAKSRGADRRRIGADGPERGIYHMFVCLGRMAMAIAIKQELNKN